MSGGRSRGWCCPSSRTAALDDVPVTSTITAGAGWDRVVVAPETPPWQAARQPEGRRAVNRFRGGPCHATPDNATGDLDHPDAGATTPALACRRARPAGAVVPAGRE